MVPLDIHFDSQASFVGIELELSSDFLILVILVFIGKEWLGLIL